MNSGTSSGWYSLLWASHFPLTVLCHTGHCCAYPNIHLEVLCSWSLAGLSRKTILSQRILTDKLKDLWLSILFQLCNTKGATQPALAQRLHGRNPTQSSWQRRSPGKQFPQNSPIRPLRTVESRTQPAEYSSPLIQSYNHGFTSLLICKYNFATVMNYMQDIWFATPKEIVTNRWREPLP